MEQLRAELSHLLGEKLSRIECVNEKADTALWALYAGKKWDCPYADYLWCDDA